jgi:hypothetical protein
MRLFQESKISADGGVMVAWTYQHDQQPNQMLFTELFVSSHG